MKTLYAFVLTLAIVPVNQGFSQKLREREQEFMLQTPLVGDALPSVEVFHPDGTSFSTDETRGSYSVLTFGCLTCPPSMWNIPGLEAVHRDYAGKGVKFYFIYKSLAHPELAGNYVQAFTQDERLQQARQASKQLGTKIPWIVDSIDNRLKHALGDRPNSQFIVDPKGTIIYKGAWSNPQNVRDVLIKEVGPTEKITLVDDLDLPQQNPVSVAAPRGIVDRVDRTGMQAIKVEPDASSLQFFAKLRAEADETLMLRGRGKLYLGFHLDPLHQAHWNNLTEPLAYELSLPNGVIIDKKTGSAAKLESSIDSDPREFLVDVDAWPKDEILVLTVVYFACDSENTCHAVKQRYNIIRQRDSDAGGARGEGAGYWDVGEFTARMLASDKNRDGVLSRSETPGIILPHFDRIDSNQDGFLQDTEVEVVTDWVNSHHQAGLPRR